MPACDPAYVVRCPPMRFWKRVGSSPATGWVALAISCTLGPASIISVLYSFGVMWREGNEVAIWYLGLAALMLAVATFALALVPVLAIVRRRERVGRCPVCDYDLRASHERCPECGAVPEVTT